MTTPDDVRRMALSLPETEEGTHFRQPSFKVRGKSFAAVEKGDAQAGVQLRPEDARAALAEDPTGLEAVHRGDRLIGLRITLATVPEDRLEQLLVTAWRFRAPKRLVAEYDSGH